jgi:hypothetical protein
MRDNDTIKGHSVVSSNGSVAVPGGTARGLTLASILLINATAGTVFAYYLFTKPFFIGTVSAFRWPQGDMELYLTGAKYFIHDDWRFPLFVTSFIERSYQQSMVMTDFVPVCALIAKIIYKVTGHEILYLAWWYLLDIVLQPVAFSLLLWFGGVQNKLLLICGGIFSLLVPAFLYRVGHAPLFGQFTITTAMALYFASARKPNWPKWLLIAWPLWLLLCSMINMYVLVMVGVFFGASLGQTALADYRLGRPRLIGWRLLYASCVIAAVAALMFVLGFFVPYAASGGYGFHSTNLISPFIPQLTTLFTNSLTILDATGGQYEGYNYLGAGFLALILFSVACGDGRSFRLLGRHPVFICALVALALFALSNVGYAGKLKIWKVPAPGFFGTFRSSGRFIWPVTYCGLFLVFYALDACRPIWRPSFVIVACLLLQWQDMRYLSDGIWNLGHRTEKPALNHDPVALNDVVAQNSGVYIAPDFGCAKSKLVNDTIMDIDWYAALQGKPTNTLYQARAPVDWTCKIDEAVIERKLRQNYLVAVFYDDGKITNPPNGSACATLADNAAVCLASQGHRITDDLVHRIFLR